MADTGGFAAFIAKKNADKDDKAAGHKAGIKKAAKKAAAKK